MIRAYHNEHLINKDDSRPFGVEIYDDEDKIEREFEFYPSLDEANRRIEKINSVKFKNPVIDGRCHWQDVVYKGKIIGALCERERGILEPIEVFYQKKVKDTPKNRKTSFYHSEDPGWIFLKFSTLQDLVDFE